jgi:hypothetical protein
VYCREQVVVEILCQPKPASGCRALGVRYLDNGEVVWLYLPKGYDPDHPETFQPAQYKDMDSVYRVVLAANGGRLWFLTRTMFGGADWHQYNVATGATQDVDNADAWKIWAALRESQARWLVDGIPDSDAIAW